MKMKRWLAGLLTAVMLIALLPSAFAAEATRAQVAEMLLQAADDYNPGVQKGDILKGDEDGALREEDAVTRAEALIMLARAFGTLPQPVGENARMALASGGFTDIPAWAQAELKPVFDAGLVAGTQPGVFSPDEAVTEEQMELFIRRAYALYGTNARDDFYAAVNKEALDTGTIKPGRMIGGTMYDLMEKSNEDVAALIGEIAHGTYEKGTGEQKISALYNNILDWDARNAAGITPIQPYLDAVESASSLDELMAVQQKMADELASPLFMGFSIAIDLKDSNRYMLTFSGQSPSLSKDIYQTDSGVQKDAFLKYVRTLLQLGGMDEAGAEREAQRFWQYEKALSTHALDQQEYGNVDKIYNVLTMDDIRAAFPNVDIDAVFAQSGLAPADKVVVSDVGLMRAYAELFTEENLALLKTIARVSILAGYGGALSHDFIDASNTYQQEFLGMQGAMSDEDIAAQVVQVYMADYLGQAYVERHFSPEAKADVEEMVREFIAIYKDRIAKLDWMSQETKAKAIRKHDAMKVKIGYPDEWRDDLADVDIRAVADGGSYFENIVAISKANKAYYQQMQNAPVDKSVWAMNVYTVNACYMASFNEILFPAGILQAPMYDVDAPREQNLGAIGYVIAHEITHAFDNNGAKFDENGNAADWWTAEDYAAFQKLCDETIAYYDGQEAAPGITCNGTLTLSENIADLGAAACVTEAAKRMEKPDMQLLYESMARTWQSVASREYRIYASQVDVHAPDKLRGSRALQSCDEFYEAFGIQPGDGMYLAPEERVQIWLDGR